jgi:hypothetical protein
VDNVSEKGWFHAEGAEKRPRLLCALCVSA